jgi:hypothetical protein
MGAARNKKDLMLVIGETLSGPHGKMGPLGTIPAKGWEISGCKGKRV